jgi:hypothetical protein
VESEVIAGAVVEATTSDTVETPQHIGGATIERFTTLVGTMEAAALDTVGTPFVVALLTEVLALVAIVEEAEAATVEPSLNVELVALLMGAESIARLGCFLAPV